MAEINWDEYFRLSKEAKCPEDIKKLHENPPLKSINLMDLKDSLCIIGDFVKLDNKNRIEEKELFKKTNKQIKNLIINYLNVNGVSRNNGLLNYMDGELYDYISKVIDDNMKEINKETVDDFYYKNGYIYETYNKIKNTPIYLNVSYHQKENAKALKAKWDKENKKWYGFIYNKELIEKYK